MDMPVTDVGALLARLLAIADDAVIVVDDASPDATADQARAGDDGSGRLKVMRLDVNGGPAAARNLALPSGYWRGLAAASEEQ